MGDLEEAAPATAQWGRRRRRFFDYRRRRRRFFDYRRRRRRTNYPTPFPTPYPTPAPTGVLGHHTCKKTKCVYSAGQTEIFTTTPLRELPLREVRQRLPLRLPQDPQVRPPPPPHFWLQEDLRALLSCFPLATEFLRNSVVTLYVWMLYESAHSWSARGVGPQ